MGAPNAFDVNRVTLILFTDPIQWLESVHLRAKENSLSIAAATARSAVKSKMKFLAPYTIGLICLFIHKASAAVTLDYLRVDDLDITPDTTGFGAVTYEYRISKYEVTNAQYAEFLNAKASSDPYALYNTNMSSYGIQRIGTSGNYTYSVTGALANRPVVLVSWYDAARFANWLANGQGGADTENGSYTLNGLSNGIITRNASARICIPTENEWYKAGYYNGATSNFSLFPNGNNTITTLDANFGYSVGSSTDVGIYANASSFYGTYDQGGNVWEWNDAVINEWSGDAVTPSRGLRGGSWGYADSGLATTGRNLATPSSEFIDVGFRLAVIPEPTAYILVVIGGYALLSRRSR